MDQRPRSRDHDFQILGGGLNEHCNHAFRVFFPYREEAFKTIGILAHLTPPMGPGDRKVITFTVYIPLVLEMIQTKVVTIGLVFFKKKLKMKNH